MENPVSNVDPEQMPHYVASNLSLHCWPITLLRFPGKNGLRVDPPFEGFHVPGKQTESHKSCFSLTVIFFHQWCPYQLEKS